MYYWGGENIKMENEKEWIRDFQEMNTEMLEQIQREAYKGINRIICIIKEYGRKWDKKYIDNENVKQGGFQKLVKDNFLKANWPDDVKQALSHL